MTWLHSAPSNQTSPIHQHNSSQDEDSPSDLPGLLVEETLEFQAEYPREEAEEVEEAAEEEVSLPLYLHNRSLLIKETNSLATRHSYSQEIVLNQKHS